MRVLFIQQDPVVALGLMSLSAYLKKYGHTVDVIVTAMVRDWLSKVGEFNPDLVAMSCTTGAHTFILSVADIIKQNSPDVLVVLGGSHPTFHQDVIRHPSVDIIVLGEAEYALEELLQRLEAGEDFSHVLNLHVKSKAGTVTKNPPRPLEQNLDVFPFPDRHLYDKYGGLQHQTDYQIAATRGCSYDCSFCYNAALKALYRYEDAKARYVRARSTSNVIEELKAAKAEWNLRNIEFQDDVFPLYSSLFFSEFLTRFKEEVAVPFTACIRPDLVTEGRVSRLKDAGCVGLMMGLEAADSTINNDVLGRHITRKQIIDAADIIHKCGIKLKTFSMLGSPGETLETALETLKLNQRIKPECPRCSLTQPYPKTPLLEYCVRMGLLEEGFDVDKFESSYYVGNPIKFDNKHEVLRLHKIFPICVRWPILTPVLTRLVQLKGGDRFFLLLFNLHFAYESYKFYDYNLLNFLKVGLRTRHSTFFSRRTDEVR